MAIVTYVLRRGQPLTPEQEAELEYLRNMPDDEIDFSDIPKLTDEELKKFRLMYPRPKKFRADD